MNWKQDAINAAEAMIGIILLVATIVLIMHFLTI